MSHSSSPSGQVAVRLFSFLVLVLFFCASATSVWGQVPANEDVRRRFRRAFSPVGKWKITKMNVILASVSATNPSMPGAGSGGAAMGNITMEIGSSLGGDSYFEVHSDGTVTGGGAATYRFAIAAGSTAFGLAAGPGGFSVPIGGQAALVGDPLRKFTITGTADLVNRTIALKAFNVGENTADGWAPAGNLKGIITPGQIAFEWPVWPAMTNTVGEVLVHGATLLYQVEGKIPAWKFGDTQHYFWCSFEAVKYVDLGSLLELASAGPSGPKGDPGPKGDKGDPGERGQAGQGVGYLAGTVVAPVGRATEVRFDRPLTDDKYVLSLTPQLKERSRWIVGFANKSKEGFTVLVTSNDATPPAGEVTVDWIALVVAPRRL